MCGFLVYYPLSKSKKFDKDKFFKSAKLISHRGPDEKKFYFSKDINMIFYRLSIIDLSKNGSQPMISSSQNSIIVFNGEIYNAKELRIQLDEKKFKGKSDTEVILKYYEKYGPESLKYFKGMFSLVIYDFKKKSCFVARDRFGIKPLYYSINNDYVIFSSEIKPILFYKKYCYPNPRAFGDFLIHQELESKYTFFKGINLLRPSTFKIFNRKNVISRKYWSLVNQNQKKDKHSFVIEKFNYYLDKSINRHLVSDRKIGLSLSGGNDSEIIANRVRKFKTNIQTITYGFENSDANEIKKALAISKENNFENHSVIISNKYIVDNFQNIINELESPFTSIRLFGMRKLFKRFKSLSVPVVLEGSGGDEMLGGYDYNVISHFKDISKNKLEFIKRIKILSKKRKSNLQNYLNTFNYQNQSTKDCSNFLIPENFNIDFFKEYREKKNYFRSIKFNKLSFLKKSQLVDINHINIPRSLKYIDRLSMISGIEARPVYLDHELFKFCFNLNNEFKIKNLKTRFLMRELVSKKEKEYLKNTITDPQRNILMTNLNELFNDTFHSRKFKENVFFNYKNVIKNFNDKKIIKKNSFSYFQIFTSHLMMENFNLI